MKDNTLRYLFMLLAFVSLIMYGQDFSNLPKVKTNEGIECYIYTVEAKEGLYGISRKFDVKQEDIIRLNPEANQGLKVGQQLLIPVKQQQKANLPTDGKLQFTQYVVPPKQTIYSICKEFGITQDELEKYNPEIKDGLREGAVLRIPQKTTATVATSQIQKTQTQQAATTQTTQEQTVAKDYSNPATAYQPSISNNRQPQQVQQQAQIQQATTSQVKKSNDSKYIIHVIKPQETLFSISRQYNIHVEDIINANPLLESTLKIGEEIRIPLKSPFVSPVEVDSLFQRPAAEPVKIAFLLPFFSFSESSANRFLEFYSGALIAINDAKERGISFEIYTYDTDKTEEKIQQVLASPELKKVDFIIGPAYTNQISYVADFARQNRIYTLIPFSSKVAGIAVNPYLIQFNPGVETEVDFEVEQFTSGQYRNSNIIFIKPQNVDVTDDGWTWTQALQTALTKSGKSYRNIDWTDSNDKSALEAAMKSNQRNLIIFRTDRYPVIQPYLSTLTTVSGNYSNTSLFVQYNWLGYSLQQSDVVYVSAFLSEMNNSALNVFQQKFSSFFNWDVTYTKPRYDLLGYDLTSCFINELNSGGSKFGLDKTSINYPAGIQSQFLFQRENTNSGFINQRLYMTNTSAE